MKHENELSTMKKGGTNFCVIHVMHLIENDEFDVANKICTLVQHTPQNFGRHDEAVRFRIYLHISCEDTDRCSTKSLFEISILLI